MGIVLSLPHMRHFLAKGWQIFAICPDGPRLAEVAAAGVTVLPLRLSRRLVDPFGDIESAVQIVRYCREYEFDLVHTHNIKAGLIGRVASRLGGSRRIIHTMHGMAFGEETSRGKRFAHASLEWLACRFADRVLVQSDEDLATMEAHHLIASDKIVQIGNGIDLTRFDPSSADRDAMRTELGLHANDILFVSAGRLVRSKGFVELCAAAIRAGAIDPRIKLAIAGPRDSEKADSLTDSEIAAAEEGGVVFLGERRDMPAIYAAADVVALASWHEGMPRVLLEGAAMGKPLLATDARGCREVVRAQGGTLTSVGDVDALSRAMIQFAADPVRRRAAGEHNRRLAHERFDLKVVIERLDQVYVELLEHR